MRSQSRVIGTRQSRPAAVEAIEPRLLLSTVSFQDTFKPTASPLWSNSHGDWVASNGTYSPKTPSNTPYAASLLPYTLTNFTLSVQVNELGDSGIIFGANSSLTTGAILIIGGAGYGQGQRGGEAGTSLYFQVGAAQVGFVQNAFKPGSTHTITVKVSGDTCSAYIDKSKSPATTLTSSAIGSGLVGLYDDQPNVAAGGFGTPTTFSDFTLTGTAAAVSISGTVFNDSNGNGKIDSGEHGISGVKVFLDLKDTGKFVTGDPVTTTAANGTYSFSNVTPGAYHVAEVLPTGLITTLPVGGVQTVSAFAKVSGINFGDAAPVTVSGTVFLDSSGDGVINGSDKGLAGFTVFIDYNNNGKFDGTDVKTTTNAKGQFNLTGLRPGSWSIVVMSASGYTATTPTKYSVVAFGGMSIGAVDFGELKAS
jgi:hypothetical protein